MAKQKISVHADADQARADQVLNIKQEVLARFGRNDSPTLTGFEDEYTRNLYQTMGYLWRSGLPSLAPLLPMLLTLKGKPYKLDNYFPFEPFFKTEPAQEHPPQDGPAGGQVDEPGRPGRRLLQLDPVLRDPVRDAAVRDDPAVQPQLRPPVPRDQPVKRLFLGSKTMQPASSSGAS
jgi:hypothetical protein